MDKDIKKLFTDVAECIRELHERCNKLEAEIKCLTAEIKRSEALDDNK